MKETKAQYDLDKTPLTLEKAKNLKQRPQTFLCKMKANNIELQFVHFKLRNPDTGRVYIETEFKERNNADLLIDDDQYPPEILAVLNEMRFVQYKLPIEFLTTRTLSCSLKLKIGDKIVESLVMVENHYFNNHMIAQFEFKLPFCGPNTKNTAEYIYELPELDEKVIAEINKKRLSTFSDTFFFADGVLVMHNKAEYSFRV